MPLKIEQIPTVTAGATVPVVVYACDWVGTPVDVVLAVSVTGPAMSVDTLTMTSERTGVWRGSYVALAGTSLIQASASEMGVVSRVVLAVALDTGVVTVAEARAYLGDTVSVTDGELAKVIAAEQAAQAQVCMITHYTPDLREALLRRCARNIAARNIPVATYNSFDGGGAGIYTRVPNVDAEIRRLEGPYRRMVTA